MRVPNSLGQLRKAKLLNYAILAFGAFLMVLPFFWMVSTSFKWPSEAFAFPPTLWPRSPTLTNYLEVFRHLDVSRLYWNTTLVTLTKTLFMLYTGALLGYIFSKFRFWARDAIFFLVISTMVVPFEVYMIPLYQMVVSAKLADTYTALILPYLFSAYAVFLFRQFMFTIPTDLMDAARIDGAGEMYIFHRIILPLCRPVWATLAGFYFMWNWNDFLWPLIVISDQKKQLLSVALATLVPDYITNYGPLMAGAALLIIPTLLVFLAAQRYLTQGIVLSGFK